MLCDTRHDELLGYGMRASIGAVLLGGVAGFFLFVAGGQAPFETKLLYASFAAIVGGAFGTISAAKDRNETHLGLALAYAIVGVVLGPLLLGLGVAVIDVVAWVLGIPAPVFTDLGWTWWIGAMVLASGLLAASTLSKVAENETSKTSLRYVLCEFFGQALGPFAIVLVAWMCFEPAFPTREQWPLAVIIIAAGCAVLEAGSRIVRFVFRRIAGPADR
jgi:hypothetical protein